MSLMLVVICLGSVGAGTLSFLIFTGSPPPFLGLLLTMTEIMGLLLIVWFGLLVPSPRSVGWCMLCGIGHFCLGLLLLGNLSGLPCAEDIAHWPYTTGLLVKWVAFLGSLHWPVGGADLGVGGVSYVEVLILYELWAGEKLTLEKAHPRYLRPGRPISVSAVPFGPGIDIWRSLSVSWFPDEVPLYPAWWTAQVCSLCKWC